MKNSFRLATAFLLLATSAVNGFAQEEYELRFEGRWFDTVERPGNAHFTTIVGATHNSAGALFGIGATATPGVESVAELGGTSTIAAEINASITAGTAGSLITGTNGFITPEETNTFRFFATEAHSQLTFLTMLAPSPDWFVGVHDLELRNGGGWRDSIVLNLNSYDAGTEDGTGLSLSNPATSPLGTIQLLDSAEPTNALLGAGSLARVTLTRINAAAVPEPSSLTILSLTGLALLKRRRV